MPASTFSFEHTCVFAPFAGQFYCGSALQMHTNSVQKLNVNNNKTLVVMIINFYVSLISKDKQSFFVIVVVMIAKGEYLNLFM